ncbi:hypothetical protein ACT7CW_00135 [Bacillus pacificus]
MILQTRWSEKPTTIIPMILNNIRDFEAGASKRKFEEGLQEALKKGRRIIRAIGNCHGENKVEKRKRNDS